jgi:lauroyl/myristoyl acyltransferase
MEGLEFNDHAECITGPGFEIKDSPMTIESANRIRKAQSDVSLANGTIDTLPDTAKLKLHCTLVRPVGPGIFSVIRWGGATCISTREIGVEALRLFDAKRTLAEVKAELANHHHRSPEAIELTPLLRSLHAAQLIRSVDGHALTPRARLKVKSYARFILRFYVREYLLDWALKHPQRRLAWSLTYWVYRFDHRKPLAAKVNAAARKMEDMLPAGKKAESGSLHRGYYHHLIQNIVDFRLLTSMTPAAAEAWLEKHTACTGLEHLAQAVQHGKGVILCGYHFSSVKSIPFILMKHGYSTVQIGLPGFGADKDRIVRWVNEFQRLRPGNGAFEVLGDFGLDTFRRFLQTLRAGRILISLPDVYMSADTLDAETKIDARTKTNARLEFFNIKAIQTGLPQSRTVVSLLGRNVKMNGWVGWFADATGAAVLPTFVVRDGHGKLTLHIETPGAAFPNSAARIRAINSAVFRTLEQVVAEYPTQWFGWHTLQFAQPAPPEAKHEFFVQKQQERR